MLHVFCFYELPQSENLHRNRYENVHANKYENPISPSNDAMRTGYAPPVPVPVPIPSFHPFDIVANVTLAKWQLWQQKREA